MTRKTLLIDGDTALYRIACGGQRHFEWSNGAVSDYAHLEHAIERLDAMIAGLVERLHAKHAIVALTDDENWRTEVYPAYKENRKGIARPLLWTELRQHFKDNYQTFTKELLEGDDILGILATHPTLVRGPKVIVGIDKDLLTIPGHHYNPVRETHVVINEAEADYNHLYQTLTGDTIDGYHGCPRVGKIRARRILVHGEEWDMMRQEIVGWDTAVAWGRVVEAYLNAGLTKDDALAQARVARILRAGEYNLATKEITLWTPPCQD